MNQIHIDKMFGLQSETEMIPFLNKYFNDTLIKTADTYDSKDFVGLSGIKYELKTRRISSRSFNTTILPCSKVRDWRDTRQTVYVIFKYTDGCYFIKYGKNMKIWDTFVRAMVYCNARWGDPEREHVFIPIQDLTKMELKK